MLLLSTLFYLFFIQIQLIYSQRYCSNAPSPDLKIVCEQLHRWDKIAREKTPSNTNNVLPPAIPSSTQSSDYLEYPKLGTIASTPYQCMDLNCLCSFMNEKVQQGSTSCKLSNGRPLSKAIRKEYRMLSDDERDRFHSALLQLKIVKEYDRLAQINSQFTTASGFHAGPASLPSFREYLKRFEIAIRLIDSTLALPYYNSELDSHLKSPKDSVIWTDEFMGTTDSNGHVITGPFSKWQTSTGHSTLLRKVGYQGSVIQQYEINNIMQQTEIENILTFSAPQNGCPLQISFNALEYISSNMHHFVGGDMYNQTDVANDPIFFLHHAFIDLIWENWRLEKQNRSDRETLYPRDTQLCSSKMHFSLALMRPFEPLRNIDGLSNKYTDNLYSYAPHPTCTTESQNCGSKYLFCLLSKKPRCVSKIKLGGYCAGFVSSESVCYNGLCKGKYCVEIPSIVDTRRSLSKPVKVLPPTINLQTLQSCYNEHECCSTWSKNMECQRNPDYMNIWCKASCKKCQSYYNLEHECFDRHIKCSQWARNNECIKNDLWMTENCRKSCNKCLFTRFQVCNDKKNQNRINECASSSCHNENVCCQIWGASKQWQKTPNWIACNCRVSTGYCTAKDYTYGTCENYHPDCQRWSELDECNKNGWMLENCRLSCKTCINSSELQNICRLDGNNIINNNRFQALMLQLPNTNLNHFSLFKQHGAKSLQIKNSNISSFQLNGMPAV